MRKVSHHMGMPISIDLPKCSDISIFTACWALCSAIDEQFSPYKPSSEVTKIAKGQLQLKDSSHAMQDIIKSATHYEKHTDGYFSIFYNGSFNPSGIVKAWAIQSLEDLLRANGYTTYLINAGGDIICASSMGQKWKLGISHPDNANSSIGTVRADNAAIATSGNYQKGNHIYNPKTKYPATGLKSVTVIGPKIITADVYATALFAMGYKAISYAKKINDYKVLIVDTNNYVYSV